MASGRRVPVLMPGNGSLFDLIECIEGGADDYVAADSAPPLEILTRAYALCRRARYPAQPQYVRANGSVIDEARRHVTVAGRAVELAASELRVLTTSPRG